MSSRSATKRPGSAASSVLRFADDLRRRNGRLLDALGFGPKPSASRTVQRWRALDLVAYQAANAHQSAVLIVPAPIKAAYIWDLAPGASAVERFLSAGLQVYMAVWRHPEDGDECMGLEEYAVHAISACLDEIRSETGQTKALLAGHSLGGTFAAIFSSLNPSRVNGLVALEAPIAFGSGLLEAVVANAPDASAIGATMGNVPGTFLDWASRYADPVTFDAEPLIDWMKSTPSPSARRLHLQVRRWSLDESPMARQLFEDVLEKLYRENRFAEGRLRIGGRVADPQAMDMPILAVLDPRSRIVPASSVEAYRTRTRSKDVRFIDYDGDAGVMIQHVGVLVGENAHRLIWPQIQAWVRLLGDQ